MKPFHVAISAGPDRPGENGWRGRHERAIMFTWNVSEGGPLVNMLRGWYDYAVIHQQRYESLIGDDGFLGKEWESIGDALRALLNGECGHLDCGTVDGFLLNTMRENGIDTEHK